MTGAKNIAASVRAKLLNRARERGEDYNYLVIRFIQERLLYRLSQSQHAEAFVLKGATLFTLWHGAPHRPTKDVDFLGTGTPDAERLRAVFVEVLSTSAVDDGLDFQTHGITAAPIREEAVYDGIRLVIPVAFGSGKTNVQVDVGFGDSIVPAPDETDFPTLLDFPAPHVRAYRPETVVAEKLHAMVELGMNNSRMKDYFDVDILLRDFDLDRTALRDAIEATFAQRQTPRPRQVPVGLSDEFAKHPDKQMQWRAFLRRAAPGSETSLLVVVSGIRERLLPSL